MTHQSSSTAPAVRHDGWTQARRAQFLEALSHNGNVLAACARVGMSREAAYRLRRREPAFARAWAAAQMAGREASAEVLGCRAIDGIEEDVWYRGELRGTKRRFDSRLLLAHVARLDKLAEANAEAVADAERLDELVALACGVEAPVQLAYDGGLPPDREACIERTSDHADRAWQRVARAGEHGDDCDDYDDYEDYEDYEDAWDGDDREDAEDSEDGEEGEDAEARRNRLLAEAAAASDAIFETAAAWDAWFGEACEAVDRLRAEPLEAADASGAEAEPGTPSELSTSAAAPDAQPEPDTPATPSGVSTSPDHGLPPGPYSSRVPTRRYARP